MATGNFYTYCGQSLAGSCLFTKVRYVTSPKKCSENFIEYFTHSKNGMLKCVSTQKNFPHFLILRYSEIKNVVHSIHVRPLVA